MILFNYGSRVVSLDKIREENIPSNRIEYLPERYTEEGIEIWLKDIPELKSTYFISKIEGVVLSYDEMLLLFPNGIIGKGENGNLYYSKGTYFKILIVVKDIFEEL